MRESNRVSVSAIALFDQALDNYEATMVTIKTNPHLFSGPAQYLQMAINRLLTANLPDTAQMMRSLCKRILSGNSSYSEYSLLMIASGTVNNIFKDEILAIVYTLMDLTRGKDPTFTDSWRNRINGNSAIENFLRYYKTSDIYRLKSVASENLYQATLPRVTLTSNAVTTIVPIGPEQIELNLTSSGLPSVQFSLGEDWIANPGSRPNIAKVYSSNILVKSGVKEFTIPKTVILTEEAKSLAVGLGCLTESAVTNYHHFKLPAAYFSCCLNLYSFDSGTNWMIGNVTILPPTLT